ncbi:hypothetical protein Mkiyose1665_48790 [Mycobacterium kiyosense]|nr:hypothetical protein IWGMT90018_05780 [Mycobacterium kiyosense]GLC10569.1 hypothetical protein SRL2020411_52150 [Mycobacterium kiyosense]GLC22037.1 hypothetical protein SRL2020472_46080 [Mycobacterium kiyosense]GLD01123.1 hypothetical protein Mkiyose1088_29890 [Mycobacterium kiyosense]GLD21171.1 hypothetical protein Mkiyose1385_52700 [Mycobacterium kiyosense]
MAQSLLPGGIDDDSVCCNDWVSLEYAQARIADIEAIKQVKYRYLRAMDTKHWDDFAETMTEDIVGAYGSSLGKELHFDNRKDLVEYLSSAMGPGVVTEHRVTHPEITVSGDTASGIWYLQDRVIVAEFDFMLIGAAFYRDQYRRTSDGWRISATGYDRTYEATMSVAGLNFNVKPGRARADLTG